MKLKCENFFVHLINYAHYALKKGHGCQHCIRVIRAILYRSKTDKISVVIRAISFRHDSYSIGVRAIL